MHKRNFGFSKRGHRSLNELDLEAASQCSRSWEPTLPRVFAFTFALFVVLLLVLPLIGIK